MEGGAVNQTLIDIIQNNVRIPEQVMGDLWAQVAANRMLGQRLLEMLEQTSCDLITVGHEMHTRSEAAMRNAIRAIPDGDYEYVVQVDGFIEPVTIKCRITVTDDTLAVDYTGSSSQMPRAINVVPIYTFAYTAYALKCVLAPTIPNNEGSFRPITTFAPLGSILNPEFPAAVSARAMTGHVLPTAIMGALATVLPGRVRAAAGSPLWCIQMAGLHDGQRFATTLFLNGGQGAGEAGDGLAALSFPSNLANTPIEVIEAQAPVRVVRRALRRGTGGLGKTRGGDGQVFEIDFLGNQPMAVSFMADRIRTAAPGLHGGTSGETGRVLLNGHPIDPREPLTAAPGSRLTLETPGGGGFGSTP